jgi:hypothetical protein
LKRIGIVSVILLLGALLAEGESYPVHTAAKKVVTEIKTYNWNSADGWFEGETKKIVVETYDEKGRCLLSELYYQKMNLIEKTSFTYEGNRIKKTTADHENKPVRTALVEQNGNTITEIVLRADGSPVFKTVSTLNHGGQVKELSYYNALDQLVFDKVFKYNNKGDAVTISLYNPDGSYAASVNIEYDSFDGKGNWLTRSEYYSYGDVYGRPRDSVHRKIEY